MPLFVRKEWMNDSHKLKVWTLHPLDWLSLDMATKEARPGRKTLKSKSKSNGGIFVESENLS